ncbi:MAG: response regulator, partial [Myxococcales bacterium]
MKSVVCALVVEDDPALRRMVATYLKAMGIFAIEAPDGRTALRELDGKVPDVICLDLMLPELSGYDLCEHIRRAPLLRDVPV